MKPESLKDKHGLPVKRIWWGEESGSLEAGKLPNGSIRTMVLSIEQFGNTLECWVVQIEDGEEVSWHNCERIASIDFDLHLIRSKAA